MNKFKATNAGHVFEVYRAEDVEEEIRQHEQAHDELQDVLQKMQEKIKETEAELSTVQERLKLYQRCVNRIDDRIEYRPFDKEDIVTIIEELTSALQDNGGATSN